MNYSHFLRRFFKENLTLKILMKILKSPENRFFRIFFSYPDCKEKKLILKILLKIEKVAHKSIFLAFWTYSEAKNWTMEISMKINNEYRWKIIFVFPLAVGILERKMTFENLDGSRENRRKINFPHFLKVTSSKWITDH